jgi:hypothetical protein
MIDDVYKIPVFIEQILLLLFFQLYLEKFKLMKMKTTLILISLTIFSSSLVMAQPGCSVTPPANTIKVMSDSTISTILSNQHYLVCPGVTLTYEGAQSVAVTYYLEPYANVISARSHTATVYAKTTSTFNACYSCTSSWAIITNLFYESGANILDTIAVNNKTECTPITFDYSNVGGPGCTPLSNKESSIEMVVKAFPNPANDVLTISSESAVISSVRVYNILGAEVMSFSSNRSQIQINTSDLQPGVYFVKVRNNKGKEIVIKSIVEH